MLIDVVPQERGWWLAVNRGLPCIRAASLDELTKALGFFKLKPRVVQ